MKSRPPANTTPCYRHLLRARVVFLLGEIVALGYLAGFAKADIGDQWILPVHHLNGGGWVTVPGAGYNGTDAYEASGPDGTRRVYWALTGASVGTGRQPPPTAELYSIEWYFPNAGGSNWQPIESQFRADAGEQWPIDPLIPWAGTYGQNHQWMGADGAAGSPNTWVTAGPGPHAPQSASYTAGDAGAYMWLKYGSWLYAKWDFGWSIDHSWSALRLTQRTGPPVIKSVTRAGTTIHLTWTTDAGKEYQVQYTTDLLHPNWQDRGSAIPATGSTLSASDDTGSDPRGFYRIVRLTSPASP